MKRSKKGLIIGICALVLVLVAGTVAGILLMGKNGGKPEDTKHVHAYEVTEVVRETTCTEDGIILLECSCGNRKTQMEAATGHTLGQWQTQMAADCHTTGMSSSVCQNCGYTVTQIIPRTQHTYILAEPTQEQGAYDLYSCSVCADQFTVKMDADTDIYSHPYISDCDPYYAFEVYCEENADYIYENLRIVDSYYYGTQWEESVPYTVSGGYGNWWTVTPEQPYKEGGIYLALRSGQVLFQNYCAQDLTFAIHREKREIVELSDDVIFLQTLENEDAGYFPYELEYSEISSSYWLTTHKRGDLEEGDILCVGNAQSLEEVLQQDDVPDVFGKIKTITYSKANKTYLIELVEPELSEVFSELDIYSDYMQSAEEAELVSSEELVEQAKAALYQSEDFAEFVCAAHATSITYLSDRGYTTHLSSLKEFVDGITISGIDSIKLEDGVLTGKVVLTGTIEIPFSMTGDTDGNSEGNLVLTFEAFVELNCVKVVIDIHEQEATIDGVAQTTFLKAGIDQEVTTGFSFAVSLQLDWTNQAKPYVLNTKSGVYHVKSCKHVDSVKDSATLENLSAEALFEKLGEGTISEDKECDTCLPLTSMKNHLFALHTKNKVVHVYGCSHIARSKAPILEISELPLEQILDKGYKKCNDCQPGSEEANGFAVQLLIKMKSEDLGDSLKQYKELAEQIGKENTSKMMELGSYPANIAGVATVRVGLYAYVDFHLEASLEYEYQEKIHSEYGVYLTKSGFRGYSYSTETPLQNSITLTGQARVDLGLMLRVSASITGLEKYCYVALDGKVGLYAEIQGALRHDFLNDDGNFAAAYFEAGLHLDLLYSARFFGDEAESQSFLDEDMQDIPFLRYGYDRIYTCFAEMPEVIYVDSIYYNLEKANLMQVKYFDIFDMSDGMDTLSITGIKNKYDVKFTLADGSHCSVDTGFLLIHTPTEAFTDELTITVTGYDKWGKFRKGNTKYDIESCTIRIEYDPLKNSTDIPEGAVYRDGHYYQLFRLEDATTLAQAKEYCESLGGYLCTITSDAEEAFVTDYLLNEGALSNIAFGLVYDADAGKWRWDNGEQMSYLDWAGEEPTSPATAVLSLMDTDYSWYTGNLDGDQTEDMLVLCEWGIYVDFSDMTTEERLDNISGFYHGWYTAQQGKTGITLGIHRTNALLQDQQMLELYAQWATDCSKDASGIPTQTFTAEDIAGFVEAHEGEYIAMFLFRPLRENPSVEDGLYTMSVSYNETANTYDLVGQKWIQRDTYIFADYRNMTLYGSVLQGDVYSSPWYTYTKQGVFYLTPMDPYEAQ